MIAQLSRLIHTVLKAWGGSGSPTGGSGSEGNLYPVAASCGPRCIHNTGFFLGGLVERYMRTSRRSNTVFHVESHLGEDNLLITCV